MPVFSVFLIVCLAFLLDFLLGEPKRFHPLVGFGNWANFIERRLNTQQNSKCLGFIAVLCCVLPVSISVFFIGSWLENYPAIYPAFCAAVLYLCIGWQSLIQHAKAISTPLLEGDIESASKALAMIVSRDTSELNEQDISKAATESVLENGADAIFCALFWFLVLGVNGVVLYRAANTLDAMWGYKNSRFLQFGFFAAKLDDAFNYIPARITALLYAVCGNFQSALQCWQQQAPTWKSPNAGPVMSSGAGAIKASLGGAAVYHGKLEHRPVLGCEPNSENIANADTINQACSLVNRALIVVLVAFFVMSIVSMFSYVV